MMRWRLIWREYRRLRALHDGASFGRLEAFGRAVSKIEQERRLK